MPLDRRVRDARMLATLAELKVLAAETFIRAARCQSPGADLLASSYPAALPHRGASPPPPARRFPSFRPRPGGGGRLPRSDSR